MPTVTPKRRSVAVGQRGLLAALRAFRRGDFTVRLPLDRSRESTATSPRLSTTASRLNAGPSTRVPAHQHRRRARGPDRPARVARRALAERGRTTWIRSTRLIDDLTQPMAEAGRVLGAVANGDLSKRWRSKSTAVRSKASSCAPAARSTRWSTSLNAFASEVTRVAREVGSEGKLGGQAHVKGVAGTWKDLTDSVNTMAGNLTAQVRNIADVTTAVANGDLSKKITVEARGEILELKGTINTMVDQLNAFASEVTRVAREVGSEGKLGGQAEVKASPVRGKISPTRSTRWPVTSPPKSQHRRSHHRRRQRRPLEEDHRRRQGRDPRAQRHDQHDGRPAQRVRSEVTRVAREVGSEGKLGGQAAGRGVAGTWKDLTDSVNTMAGNLTVAGSQHRRSHDRRCQRRPFEEDHRRRARRDSRAQRHDQHDGRPAQRVRVRSHARRARSRFRRKARRPSRGRKASPARGKT